MKRPSAILFDVGDTLLREISFDIHAGIAALESFCGIGNARCCELGDAALAALQRIHPGDTVEFPLARWLAEELGDDRPAGYDIDAIELQVWQHGAVLTPMPGVMTMLRRFESEGIAMGAVSNATFSSRILIHELQRHGMAELLRFVLSSADEGVRKPGTALFRQALSLLDVPPADVWFIGDSWQNDVVGAAQAGIWPVWLSASEPPADQMIDHLRVADWEEFAEVWVALGSSSG